LKRITLSVVFIFIFVTVASQSRIFRSNDVYVGGGISYRHGIFEDFSASGISLESYYRFFDSENYRTGIDVTYYVVDGDFSPTAFEVNLNTHFYLAEYYEWVFHGLLGGQFMWVEYDWGEVFRSEIYTGFGVNLGGIVEYDMGDIIIFAQPKVTFYNVNEFRITPQLTLGARYVF